MSIFSKLFTSSQLWESYQNYKQYGTYAITIMPTQKLISLSHSKQDAANYLKQYNDSIKLIGTTVKPDVFFYRYDFAIKRAIALIYMKKYVKMSGDNPVKLANSLIEHKQEFIRQFIDRVYSETAEKISKLKTTSSKNKRIESFENSFSPYMDEINSDNQSYIKFVASELKQGVI